MRLPAMSALCPDYFSIPPCTCRTHESRRIAAHQYLVAADRQCNVHDLVGFLFRITVEVKVGIDLWKDASF
jgi:hypothetical protein